MGWASCLEDQTDRFNESLALQSFPRRDEEDISKTTRKRIHQVESRGHDPYAEPLRLIRGFYQYYHMDSQYRIEDNSQWARHKKNLENLCDILSSVDDEIEPDANTWQRLLDVEKRLSAFFRREAVYGTYPHYAIERAKEITQGLLLRANKVQSQLDAFLDAMKSPPPETEPDADEPHNKDTLTRHLTQLQAIDIRLRADLEEYQSIQASFRQVVSLWNRFRKNFTTVAITQNYRPTLQKLNRLCLHPQQESLVTRNHDKWMRIEGVSGSGKTNILLHRALRLAFEDPNSQVRVFTINRALADLLKRTCVAIVGETLPDNLHFTSFYDFLIECIRVHDDISKFRLIDDKSKERIPDAWRDFFYHPNNIFRQRRASSLVDSIMSRGNFSRDDAGAYLRDEMIYIQSAYRRDERHHRYLSESRIGRKIEFRKDQRETCLKILHDWEEYLREGHLCGVHSISLMASTHFANPEDLEGIREKFPTHHILVDEYQDFGTIDLWMLFQLHRQPDGDNAFFFAGDINQKVYAKQLRPLMAGFKFQGRSVILNKNFRNTRQILSAARHIPERFPAPSEETIEKYSPELSRYEGGQPVVVDCTHGNEVTCILDILENRKELRVAVVSEDVKLLASVIDRCRSQGYRPYELLRNDEIDCWNEKAGDPFTAQLVVARMEAVKGFEFDSVIVSGLSDKIVPPTGIPVEERWRSAAIVYGAITRARDELVMTYTGNPSVFLRVMSKEVTGHRSTDTTGLRDFLHGAHR